MATPVLTQALTTGEVSPDLFGQVALTRMHSAASTMRNFWPSWRGGAYSRAGTAFVGYSKQTGRSFPPRLLPFQFSISQGLALEFGNFYMRVVFDGGYVTEAPYIVTGATQANPCVLTASPVGTVTEAVAYNSAVSSSYFPGDTITLAGGVFSVAAQLTVNRVGISSIAVNAPGVNYEAGDSVSLTNSGTTVTPVVLVTTTKVTGVNILSGGSGGTPGVQTLTGTTGIFGTAYQLNVTVSGGGVVTAVNSITVAGNYTENPSTNTFGNNTDVTSGGGFAGAGRPAFSLNMGIRTVSLFSPGVFVTHAPNTFTQFDTSGIGQGATFNNALFGPTALVVSNPGSYTTLPTNPVAQSGTSGTGVGATYTILTAFSPSLNTGDWMFVQSVGGMTQLNQRAFVVTVAGANLTLADVFGNPVDSTSYSAFTSNGVAARIFTLTTQYSEVDLKWLKFTQSADVLSLCCVNQDSGEEYPPVDLSRISDTNWMFTPAVPEPSISPPAAISGAASGAGSVDYQYAVTAVAGDGTESASSNIASINGAVDITSTAGTITITWSGVPGAESYNVYKALPGFGVPPPAGALFGFAGTSLGLQFIDSNIIADFAQVPPIHENPFARGKIIAITPVTFGTGYTAASTSVTTGTGSGASITPIITGGGVTGYIVDDGGENFLATDTITIASGSGSGATARLVLGPQSGTYPGVVAYFQQRRAYAYTLNHPDTYFLSQPGAFTNFDVRDPTIDTDAITGDPWSVQVNGIQFMIAVSGGLMVLTGLEAFFLTGAGGSPFSPQPLTPASQSAQPQGFNGCSPTVPPVKIYQDVLYVQAKGSSYRDFSFNISLNNYVGDDITENSPHLFTGYTIKEHAWCEEPYRLLWAVRNDGILLSLTWVKTEKVSGWSRHDTFGSFQSVCSVVEPPVDALYLATQRTLGANTAYIVERMDNRIWPTIENVWCVDCGLTLAMSEPSATLSASSATGLGSLTGVTGLVGGSGYTAATTAVVVDDNGKGPGAGAVPVLTIVGGVITNVAFAPAGAGYVYPVLVITDPAGSAGGTGASARVTLNNTMTFTTSAAVFAITDVGRVIRAGGGVATVTGFTNSQTVTANITTPIAQIQPNGTLPLPATAGDWSISTPVTVVGGLWPLIGATVTGTADGVKITPQVVSSTGTITLPTPASQVTVGLRFHAQLQSTYLGVEELQGARKDIPAATARVYASGPFRMGSNQPDGSTLSPTQIAPRWTTDPAPVTTVAAYNSATVPLCTDDIRIPVNQGYSKHGQVCVEQFDPYPLNILAFIPEVLRGDTPSQDWPKKQGRG